MKFMSLNPGILKSLQNSTHTGGYIDLFNESKNNEDCFLDVTEATYLYNDINLYFEDFE